MEALNNVMTRILNTSACSEETEGYTCKDCGTFIPAIVATVPSLNITRKVLPACQSY